MFPEGLENSEAEGLTLNDLTIGNSDIKSFQFNEFVFCRCRFIKRNLWDVTFLNCRFYDCLVDEEGEGGPVYVLGGISSPDIADRLGKNTTIPFEEEGVNPLRSAEIWVLKRLWPIGDSYTQRPSRPIYRPLKSLCQSTDALSAGEIYHAVLRLKKQGLLMEMNKSTLITINFAEINRVNSLLSEAG